MRRHLSAVAVALCLPVTTLAVAPPDEAAQVEAQLEDLGNTLKAAVMSGVLGEEDAFRIWTTVSEAAKGADAEDDTKATGEAEDEDPSDPKAAAARLAPPRPDAVRVLLLPEFGRRDVAPLQGELALDPDQARIVEAFLEDYGRAFDLAATPLQEALARYRGAMVSASIARALDDAGVRLDAAVDSARRADRGVAQARLRETMAEIDQELAKAAERGVVVAGDGDDWRARVMEASRDLDRRLADIRDRTARQLEAISEEEAVMDAAALVPLARTLRADRDQLRTDLRESIGLILTEAQRGEAAGALDMALARRTIERLLPRGRFGGESMDLRAALAEAGRTMSGAAVEAGVPRLEAWLDGGVPRLAEGLQARDAATIEREIAGLMFMAARDRLAATDGVPVGSLDVTRVREAARPFAAALRREMAASVAVRDLLMGRLTRAATEASADGGLVEGWRDAAIRRGFPSETRERWAERALRAAASLDDLGPERADALVELTADVAVQLAALRVDAVARRVARDPRLARLMVTATFEGEPMDEADAMWRGVAAAAFTAIDDRSEADLRAMLTPQQFERLPRRPRVWWQEDWGKGGDAADVRKPSAGAGKPGAGKPGAGKPGAGRAGGQKPGGSAGKT